MSNTPRIRDKRARVGTLEIETDAGGRVILRAVPPGGGTPVEVIMRPDEARSLAAGIAAGAEQAEGELS